MSDTPTAIVNIHIYGGTNQVLPNATQAVQYIYSGETIPESHREDHPDEASPYAYTQDQEQAFSRLLIYIGDEQALRGYLSVLASVRTAREVGEAIVTVWQNENGVSEELIVKESFFSLFIPFLTGVSKGLTPSNIRTYINEALVARKKAIRLSRSESPQK